MTVHIVNEYLACNIMLEETNTEWIKPTDIHKYISWQIVNLKIVQGYPGLLLKKCTIISVDQ